MNKRPLTPQQEKFCLAYTSQGETSGNAYKSYAFGYDYELPLTENNEMDYKSSEYRVCQVSGSRLLLNIEIQNRIRELYTEYLNEINVDARLSDIVKKGKDTDSIQAIKIFNDLKQRITKKIDITTSGRPLQGLSDDELQKLIG